MSELQTKFKKIVDDIETNIKNKEDLEYIKKQIYQITILFIDELDKMADLYSEKIDSIIERHKSINDRMAKIEGTVSTIEKELFVEDWEEFEINCPYCNNEFSVDFSNGVEKEVSCPECNNIIELDWNSEEEGCGGHCSGCHSNCLDEEEKIDDEDEDM